MSHSDSSSSADVDVRQIVARASDWLERRDEADWSASDQIDLDSWLAQSMGNKIEYWRLESAWKRADRLSAFRPPGRRVERSRVWPLLVGVAAALAGAVIFVVGAPDYFGQSVEKTYRTEVGGHEVVTLADGSRVEMNTDTVLHTNIGAHHRTATLERGEAYFSINHDAARPFVVSAAGHRVTDLGTKFLVRSDGAKLEVALVEGRAKFESADAWIQQHYAMLTPGDVVVATAQSMSEIRKAPVQLVNNLGWRRGVIVLHRTTLAEAAGEFNRYNAGKLVISDSASQLSVGGTFPIHDVEAFTRVAQQVFGLKVEKKGSEILISR